MDHFREKYDMFPRDKGPSKQRVMVVDDDVLVRQGMRGLLADWGCLVTTAGTSAEALVEFEEQF